MSLETPAVVRGVVTGFRIGERGLVIKMKMAADHHLLLVVPSWRPDFIGQVEVVKYALSINEDHEIRVANGFETLEPKELWAELSDPLPRGWADMSAADTPLVVTASALGLGSGTTNPFDSTYVGS